MVEGLHYSIPSFPSSFPSSLPPVCLPSCLLQMSWLLTFGRLLDHTLMEAESLGWLAWDDSMSWAESLCWTRSSNLGSRCHLSMSILQDRGIYLQLPSLTDTRPCLPCGPHSSLLTAASGTSPSSQMESELLEVKRLDPHHTAGLQQSRWPASLSLISLPPETLSGSSTGEVGCVSQPVLDQTLHSDF